MDLADADYVFTSEQGEYFAEKVVGIGDLDGDGLDDLPFHQSTTTMAKGAFILCLVRH